MAAFGETKVGVGKPPALLGLSLTLNSPPLCYPSGSSPRVETGDAVFAVVLLLQGQF